MYFRAALSRRSSQNPANNNGTKFFTPIGPFRAEAASTNGPKHPPTNRARVVPCRRTLLSLWRIWFREATGPAELSSEGRTQVRTRTVFLYRDPAGVQARQASPPARCKFAESRDIYSWRLGGTAHVCRAARSDLPLALLARAAGDRFYFHVTAEQLFPKIHCYSAR